MPAGARLTVTLSCCSIMPEFLIAVRTRSFASRTMAAGIPTMSKTGSPAETSTSTSIISPSTPNVVAPFDFAYI